MLTLEEARAYLRMDSGFEDELIGTLLASSESLCMDVARLSPAEWNSLSEYDEAIGGTLSIRGEYMEKGDVLRIRQILRTGILFALGYLFEHREEADHHELVLTLRNLLFAVREGVV